MVLGRGLFPRRKSRAGLGGRPQEKPRPRSLRAPRSVRARFGACARARVEALARGSPSEAAAEKEYDGPSRPAPEAARDSKISGLRFFNVFGIQKPFSGSGTVKKRFRTKKWS